MRQMLLRVPDELHHRLAARAKSEGRSVNAIATEMLDTSVAATSGSPRDIVRARAAARGLLRTLDLKAVNAPSHEGALRMLEGLTLTADELIDEQRGPR